MVAKAETFKNSREIVNFINEHNLQREDILDILDREGQLILIYYIS